MPELTKTPRWAGGANGAAGENSIVKRANKALNLMSDNSTNPHVTQSPRLGEGLTTPIYSPLCAICEEPADRTVFIADTGSLNLCADCVTLFGFDLGAEDGSPK